ncbi:MAG: L-lactate permease [Alicyclobacillus herbarius]|uniref:L-lactate permease n=1 Tax=Alicyclobacillus herbarius TaxID=122960 RepID=UPI00235726FE|nr:L-lactate permease [Alicyclobacillus herbarius]MCL6634009.1 L-lactate permease [Alicyclobacillus herbarius]
MPAFFPLFLSALPILAALILLIGFKVSSLWTAVLVYCLAVLLTAVPSAFHMTLASIGFASLQGLLLSIMIVFVLLFGLLLYHVLHAGGAIQTISAAFTRHAHLPVQQALLISAALGPFLEATSGFGIGIVIAAPLYLAIGFSPKKTVLLSLLTQTAVPWGALAVGTVINAELSDVSLHQLGMTSAVATVPLYLMYTLAVVVIAGGWGEVRKNIGLILTVWLLLSAGTWLTNAFISTQLAGALAGAVTAVVLLGYWRLVPGAASRAKAETAATDPYPSPVSFVRAVSPYIILVGYLVCTSLIPRISHFVDSVFVWRLPAFGYRLALIDNPGFALLLTAAAAMWIYRLSWNQICSCCVKTLQQVYPAVLSTVGFIAMSTVMQKAGMINCVAGAIAALCGGSFLLVSPLVGGLGGFISGSNSAANAMFAPFQSAMAHKLHSSALLYATSQNVSAANMSYSSPSRISLATVVANQGGREGEFTRKILPLSLVAVAIIILFNLSWQAFGK